MVGILDSLQSGSNITGAAVSGLQLVDEGRDYRVQVYGSQFGGVLQISYEGVDDSLVVFEEYAEQWGLYLPDGTEIVFGFGELQVFLMFFDHVLGLLELFGGCCEVTGLAQHQSVGRTAYFTLKLQMRVVFIIFRLRVLQFLISNIPNNSLLILIERFSIYQSTTHRQQQQGSRYLQGRQLKQEGQQSQSYRERQGDSQLYRQGDRQLQVQGYRYEQYRQQQGILKLTKSRSVRSSKLMSLRLLASASSVSKEAILLLDNSSSVRSSVLDSAAVLRDSSAFRSFYLPFFSSIVLNSSWASIIYFLRSLLLSSSSNLLLVSLAVWLSLQTLLSYLPRSLMCSSIELRVSYRSWLCFYSSLPPKSAVLLLGFGSVSSSLQWDSQILGQVAGYFRD